MKKVVLKLDVFDEKVKQKAMKSVSSLAGVDSITMDMKDKKLTVTGDIDPVAVVSKLRKLCSTDIVSVGPAKEPEKKKEEGGGGGGGGDKKKEGGGGDKKGGGGGGGDDKKKNDQKEDQAPKGIPAYYNPYPVYYHQPPAYNYNYHQQQPTPYYSRVVQEDDNNGCVIC